MLNLLHYNWSCCLERFYMGKLPWNETPLTDCLFLYIIWRYPTCTRNDRRSKRDNLRVGLTNLRTKHVTTANQNHSYLATGHALLMLPSCTFLLEFQEILKFSFAAMISFRGNSKIMNYGILFELSYFLGPDLISRGDIDEKCILKCFIYSSFVFLALGEKHFFCKNYKAANSVLTTPDSPYSRATIT